jgi:pilus assembly protein CpaB
VNPRQRRGILLMVVAVVAAIGVFVAVSRYVADVNSEVGDKVTVYQAAAPLEAFTTLNADDLRAVQVPKRWVAASALVRQVDLEGRKVGLPVEKGTTLTRDLLIPVSDLSPTEREIAINVDAVTGVAGRVLPGDLVDIYAVFADVPGLPKQVRVLVRGVRVVTVGGSQTVQKSSATEGLKEKQVLPITVALEPNDALAVTYASAFAAEVRLVKLPSGNSENRSGEKDSYDAGELGGKAVAEKAR